MWAVCKRSNILKWGYKKNREKNLKLKITVSKEQSNWVLTG